jgi:hypothetical protein
MVLRRTESGRPFAPEEALTPEEALVAYTLGSAYATRTEHVRGTLTVGKLADFVVLEDDPRRVTPDTISEIGVMATAVGGELAYPAV